MNATDKIEQLISYVEEIKNNAFVYARRAESILNDAGKANKTLDHRREMHFAKDILADSHICLSLTAEMEQKLKRLNRDINEENVIE